MFGLHAARFIVRIIGSSKIMSEKTSEQYFFRNNFGRGHFSTGAEIRRVNPGIGKIFEHHRKQHRTKTFNKQCQKNVS